VKSLLLKNFSLTSKEKYKLLVGGVIFFFIISAYTIALELKYSIFSTMIGVEYLPIAKIITFFILTPAILLDGWLVDRFKRHQLLMTYTAFFGMTGLILSLLLLHPTIGLENTTTNKYRLIGWCFLIYQEGYAPFLLGIFWSFMNSIHSPESAAKTYGFTVSCSKLGGILIGFSAYLFLNSNNSILHINIGDNIKIVMLVTLAALMLIFVPIFLYYAMKKFDKQIFVGSHTKIKNEKLKKTGVWVGIKLLIKNRYVLGIFLMIFIGDTLVEVVNYKRLLIVMNDVTSKTSGANNIASFGAKMFMQISIMHLLGFFISFFLTNSIMRFIGTRLAIFISPILAALFFLIYFITGLDYLVIWLYVIMKAMAYTINAPIRESLYIITSKDIQFKAKFTIDAIGLKLSRSTGHVFNHFNVHCIPKLYGTTGSALANNIFFSTMIVIWLVSSYFVSNVYYQAIKSNKIIS